MNILLMHPIIYLMCGLFWYVPLLTDFNLQLSLEAAHYGFIYRCYAAA
jgi:hypothetical protein